MSHASAIDVLYVMGSGLSGSTLLGRIMGAHPAVMNLGEVANYDYFFRTAAERERFCPCGEPLLDCPMWSAIRRRVEQSTGDEFASLKARDLRTFERNNHALFSAAREVSGRRLLLDSSKRRYRLDLLLRSSMFRVRIIHLVRDPRAHAHSIASNPKTADTGFYNHLHRWNRKNFGTLVLYGRQPSYLRVRYEDLVTDTERTISRILAPLDAHFEQPQGAHGESVQHDFSGNRMRFKRSSRLRLDPRYLNEMGPVRWALGTAITAPGLATFGYQRGREETRKQLGV